MTKFSTLLMLVGMLLGIATTASAQSTLSDEQQTKFVVRSEAGLEQTITMGDSIQHITIELVNCNFMESKVDSTKFMDRQPYKEIPRLCPAYTMTRDYEANTLTFSGVPTVLGETILVLRGAQNIYDNSDAYCYIHIHVNPNTTAVEGISTNAAEGEAVIFNAAGVRQNGKLDTLPRGLYIVKQDGKTSKVVKK